MPDPFPKCRSIVVPASGPIVDAPLLKGFEELDRSRTGPACRSDTGSLPLIHDSRGLSKPKGGKNYEFAHTSNGIKLLVEYQTSAKPAKTPDNDISNLFDNHVRPMFDRIQAHVSLFTDVIRPGDCKLRKPRRPGNFTNKSESRHSLHFLFQWIVVAFEDTETCVDGSLSPVLRLEINEYLDAWVTAFISYHQSLPSDPARNDEAILMLAQNKMLRMILATQAAPSEQHFDNFIADFRSLVASIKKVINSDVVRQNASLGLIPPLFWTATKCRDPFLRREALWILRCSHHTESLWDTCTVANIVERIISIEENGLDKVTSCEDIPHANRVRLIKADHVFEDNDVVLQLQRYPYDIEPKNISLERIPWPRVCNEKSGTIPINTSLSLRYAGVQGLIFPYDGLCICQDKGDSARAIDRGPMRNLSVSRADSKAPAIDPHAMTHSYRNQKMLPLSEADSEIAFLGDGYLQTALERGRLVGQKEPSFAHGAATALSSLPLPVQLGEA
ncbi:MAG: hypothetical protein Q9227_000663 [Pyrenula ochraceoflavens]